MPASNASLRRRVFRAADAEPRDGDIVIIGAGLAGLFTALRLAPLPVTVIAAAPLGEGASSMWAQGGIAAAVGEGDSTDKHAADTIAAGAGIVDKTIAHMVASEAPDCIRDLLGYGVPFDRDLEGHYVLSKEAAHSEKRVVRVSGDRAGAAIMQALIASVRTTPSIRVLEGYEADDLITDADGVTGVRLIRSENVGKGAYVFVPASAVVLATGGIGALYAQTTNPGYARGEAIAMAARAGAVIADAEFVQFHPTALKGDRNPSPLITEALRGEGAFLIDEAGRRFMPDYDPRAELAPRDIVARAVFAEITAGHQVFLDCREAIGARFPQSFPTVWEHCQAAGIDPTREPIPVATAEHYHMGGIATDARGRSSLVGLWAVGEVASTGLHGGNRLASNSLLEAVVFAASVGRDISKVHVNRKPGHFVKPKRVRGVKPVNEKAREASVTALQAIMTKHVGVVRSAESLRTALTEFHSLEAAARDDVVFANMLLAARFVAAAALLRTESRGGHFRSDYPKSKPTLAHRSMLTLVDIETISAKATNRRFADAQIETCQS